MKSSSHKDKPLFGLPFPSFSSSSSHSDTASFFRLSFFLKTMSDSEHDSSSSSGGEEEAWAENLAEISDLIKKYANALVKAGEGATLISEAWKDYCKGNKEKKVKAYYSLLFFLFSSFLTL